MLPDAVRAVQRGFHIFPCNELGTIDPVTGDNIEKVGHLLSPDLPYKIRWSEAATNDLRRVVQLWTQWPFANIGVACKQSNILVVDCDIPKREYDLKSTQWAHLHDALGPLVDGETVFSEVCQRYGGNSAYSDVQATYRVATGSGGSHYYFWWPAWRQATQKSIVKGIVDIRCNGGERGGYVLGEGSEASKGSYVRESPGELVMDCPPWLVELCLERERFARPEAPEYEKGGSVNYGGLAEAVAYAPEGNRNNCLLWAARSMCTDGASIEEALEVLGEAAQAAGLTGLETRDTIRSAYRLQGMK